MRLDALHHINQDHVTGYVAIGIIYLLEVIKVDHSKSTSLPAPLYQRLLFAQFSQQPPAASEFR